MQKGTDSDVVASLMDPDFKSEHESIKKYLIFHVICLTVILTNKISLVVTVI
jgi:hypothetical protein